jgi:DNA replication and repair protein RecF
VTVFFGENGAGKTNFLEGLALLGGRPSFRGARPSEMGAGERFFLSARIARAGAADDVGVEWCAGGRLACALRGRRVGPASLVEAFPGAFMAPEDRSLFEGPPEGRRRFLDRVAVSLAPAALAEYSRFHRALGQRNALLVSGGADQALEAWTEEFVGCAAAVSERRRHALAIWAEEFRRALPPSGPLSGISLSYSPDGDEAPSRETYRRQALRLRDAERRRGHTLFGPQRDDLSFQREGRPFARSASSGEIKRAAFLMRLSEGKAVAAERGLTPLYALDDFDADLSPAAAEALLACVPAEAQVLLTTARSEAIGFCPRKPDVLYEVSEGRAARFSTRLRPLRKIG